MKRRKSSRHPRRHLLCLTRALLLAACLAPLCAGDLQAQTTRARRATATTPQPSEAASVPSPAPPSSSPAQASTAPPAAARSSSPAARREIVVQTAPNAFVWIDDLRRGTADASGTLRITPMPAGRRTLRARAHGFREATVTLTPARRGTVRVPLQPTTDAAELAFGEAEELRETATANAARERALELYARAIALRPRFLAAHTGRARTLFDLARYDEAHDAVADARRLRPAFAEASVIEGRIFRAQSDNEEAIAAYERALREARGRQPEALTGLGIIYEEHGKYTEAAAALRRALAQLQDSEPIIYQLLGSAHEQAEQYKEAVAAYEKYLALAPDGTLAPAIRSVIEQLRRQAAGESTLPF